MACWRAETHAGSAEGLNVTSNQATVLRLLGDGFKLRVRSGTLRLKQPDYIGRFEECPGGQTTVDELVSLGYIDARNNITEAGRSALASADSSGDLR